MCGNKIKDNQKPFGYQFAHHAYLLSCLISNKVKF